MDNILEEINRKKVLLDSYKPLPKAVSDNLEEWFRVELTYTSNAIEGNTLTRQETALVVEKGITIEGKSVREHLEAINHAEAFSHIQELANCKRREELTLQDILDIHRIILRKIDDIDAGRLRNIRVRIAGSTTILPNPIKVPELMEKFVKWLQTTTENSIKVAIDAHYQLVTIHPFVDGNGRTARLLMNLILMQAGFPPAIIKKEERNRYLTVLEAAQTKNNQKTYYELMHDAINRSLDLYLETVGSGKEETAVTINEQTFYTTSQVAALLQVDVESIRRYVRSGKLKAVRLGGKFIRIEKKDLDHFIKQQKG